VRDLDGVLEEWRTWSLITIAHYGTVDGKKETRSKIAPRPADIQRRGHHSMYIIISKTHPAEKKATRCWARK